MSAGGLWRRLTRGVTRLWHRADWPAFAGTEYADRIMDVAVTDRYHAKQGRSTGRWVLRSGERTLVVYLKRHRQLPWWTRLLATLWPRGGWSPAWREWEHLNWARGHGIPAPEPIAVGERIGPWLRLESFLAVAELTAMIPLHEAVPQAAEQLDPAVFRRWKRLVIDEIARLARLLHADHRYHKDFYLCHFFVAQTDWTNVRTCAGRISLIDLHRLGRHRWTGWHWRVKDLAQLLYSSAIPGVDDRDRLRFFRAYRGQRRLDVAGRRLLRRVLTKAGRYRRHNAKRTGGVPAAPRQEAVRV